MQSVQLPNVVSCRVTGYAVQRSEQKTNKEEQGEKGGYISIFSLLGFIIFWG